MNYPIIFYALKFMPKRRQKTKDSLARKKFLINELLFNYYK